VQQFKEQVTRQPRALTSAHIALNEQNKSFN